jgi:hypothetical protein
MPSSASLYSTMSLSALVFTFAGCSWYIDLFDLKNWGACIDSGGLDTYQEQYACEDAGREDGTSAEQASRRESCAWDDIGVCFEFTSEEAVEAWCVDIGATYDVTTSYAAAGCSTAELGTCVGLTGGEFGDRTADAYYYAEFGSDPEDYCIANGGSYSE